MRELPTTPFQRHPWEVARARFFVDIVRSRTRDADPVAVLDVGAGDGYVSGELLRALPPGSRVVCFDANYTSEHLRRLNERAPAGLTYSRECRVRDVDWLLLLDVIEHVAEDVALLEDLTRERLRPGGHALVSMPAWPSLFSDHDAMLGHYRRYRPEDLDVVLARSGLDCLDRGSLFTSLLVPRSISKLREVCRGVKGAPGADGGAPDHVPSPVSRWRGGPALGRAITWMLGLDARASRALERYGIDLPGLSTWALARRKETMLE
ncbi:MAG: class I SAM-dependent methyltransferase [Myxococcales bacterium]|nr:class I SAM-dependent methyltransferase [Myxococcales bacterium]